VPRVATVRLDACGFPWRAARPLVFHTLTSLPEGLAGTEAFMDLVANDAALVPSALRREPWNVARRTTASGRSAGTRVGEGRLVTLDAEAGDGRWLFFSAGKPYRGVECWPERPQGGEITVAFDLDVLFASGHVGWRPHDLLGLFGVLPKRWRRMRDRHGFRRTHDFDRGAELRRLAEWATITESGVVRQLVKLTVLHLALLEHDTPEARARARRNRKAVLDLVAGRIQARPDIPGLRESDLRWAGEFKVPAEIDANWGPLHWLFGPEILCDGAVPLRCASYWQDGEDGQWRRMGEARRPQLELPFGGGAQ
jgi:hypothetical protein